MKIRIEDKWLLTTDGKRNFEVSEIKVIKDGPKKGEEVLVDTQYPSSLENALNNLVKRSLLRSDATSFAELLEEIKDLKAYFKEKFKDV